MSRFVIILGVLSVAWAHISFEQYKEFLEHLETSIFRSRERFVKQKNQEQPRTKLQEMKHNTTQKNYETLVKLLESFENSSLELENNITSIKHKLESIIDNQVVGCKNCATSVNILKCSQYRDDINAAAKYLTLKWNQCFAENYETALNEYLKFDDCVNDNYKFYMAELNKCEKRFELYIDSPKCNDEDSLELDRQSILNNFEMVVSYNNRPFDEISKHFPKRLAACINDHDFAKFLMEAISAVGQTVECMELLKTKEAKNTKMANYEPIVSNYSFESAVREEIEMIIAEVQKINQHADAQNNAKLKKLYQLSWTLSLKTRKFITIAKRATNAEIHNLIRNATVFGCGHDEEDLHDAAQSTIHTMNQCYYKPYEIASYQVLKISEFINDELDDLNAINEEAKNCRDNSENSLYEVTNCIWQAKREARLISSKLRKELTRRDLALDDISNKYNNSLAACKTEENHDTFLKNMASIVEETTRCIEKMTNKTVNTSA